jgi:hypothetical protein
LLFTDPGRSLPLLTILVHEEEAMPDRRDNASDYRGRDRTGEYPGRSGLPYHAHDVEASRPYYGRIDDAVGYDEGVGIETPYERTHGPYRPDQDPENARRQERRGGFYGVGPKGYRRADDRIAEEVCERLTRDHGVDASEITVEVDNGHVTLSGTVRSRQEKRRAEDLSEVFGVSDIENRLKIEPRVE